MIFGEKKGIRVGLKYGMKKGTTIAVYTQKF